MQIAICDDDKIICADIETILFKIASVLKITIDIEVFYTGEEIEKYLLSGINYDIIFLDIELQSTKGTKIGDTIRNKLRNENTFIIYISSKESYALSLFKTRPLDFLVKPITEKDIERVFLLALELSNRNNEYFEFKVGQKLHKTKIKDILYFESSNKKCCMVTIDGAIEFYAKLSDIIEQLNRTDFLAIHKSYLVNYQKIIEFQYDKVIMLNGVELPISQNRRKQIRYQQIRLRRGY